MRRRQEVLAASLALLAVCLLAAGQAGRRPAATASRERGAYLNVVATRDGGSTAPVTAQEVALYDGGLEQNILAFSPDPTPARIVLLIDNSLSLRTDVPKLQQVPREFAYEIFEGDQLLVVGYNEQAEIVSDWTDDAKVIEASLKSLRKKGDPRLFDALAAVVEDALRPLSGGVRKRVIVLVGDGLDRGSKTKFEQILAELQSADIAVYALQIPDRTGGAHRRDQPKASEVVRKLVEGTGGRILPLDEPREAAKAICDELRKHRYVLSYTPSSVSYLDTRRLLLVGNNGITVRVKAAQPPK